MSTLHSHVYIIQEKLLPELKCIFLIFPFYVYFLFYAHVFYPTNFFNLKLFLFSDFFPSHNEMFKCMDGALLNGDFSVIIDYEEAAI